MKFLRPVPSHFPVSNPYGHWEPYSNYYIAPTTGTWVHGQYEGNGQHKGTDFAVPVGTPIQAACDGLIVMAGWENHNDPKQGFGQRVRHQIVNEGGTPMTIVYGHMSVITVRAGDQVKRGDRIGLSGNTGHTTGPHLHVELVDGRGQYHEMLFDEPTPPAEAPTVAPGEGPASPQSEVPPQSA